MANIYAGGIPPQGGKMVFPGSTSDGDSFVKPNAGPSEESATKGGPGTPHGSDAKNIVNDAGYKAPGDERPGAMKTINLNDVSNEA